MLAQQDKWTGGTLPLGYKYDRNTKQITIDNDRVDDAIAVFETFLACNANKRQTAVKLNAMGIKTREGNLWRDDALGLIVRNPIYRGKIHYNDIQTEADIERIIPDEMLVHVDLMACNGVGQRTRSAQGKYAYSKILTCAKCGYTLKVKTSKQNVYYICRGQAERGIC